MVTFSSLKEGDNIFMQCPRKRGRIVAKGRRCRQAFIWAEPAIQRSDRGTVFQRLSYHTLQHTQASNTMFHRHFSETE